MTPLNKWAERHAVSPGALLELAALLGAGEPPAVMRPQDGQSEAAVQQLIRLEVARRGGRVWRNNSGATQDESGRVVRFGLGNDSKQVCAIMKSSDLIGVTPVECMCGRRYGVFTAYEVKAPGWKLRPSDKRAQAQLNYINLVTGLGGIARFVTGPEEVV